MALTTGQTDLIRESFALLQPEVETASERFYERLFALDPSLRELFRSDMAGQGMKFMTTLGYAIDNIQHHDKLGQKVEELGRSHGLIGVKAAHFAPMGEALIETLREELKEDFTAELETAWRAAYDDLSERVIRRGGLG